MQEQPGPSGSQEKTSQVPKSKRWHPSNALKINFPRILTGKRDTLDNPRDPNKRPEGTKKKIVTDVLEVWFAGCHSGMFFIRAFWGGRN